MSSTSPTHPRPRVRMIITYQFRADWADPLDECGIWIMVQREIVDTSYFRAIKIIAAVHSCSPVGENLRFLSVQSLPLEPQTSSQSPSTTKGYNQ